MNADELAAATAEYDREWTGPGLPGKPLSTAQRSAHRRAAARAKKMGRPKIGKGAKIVPVTVERGLLKQADDFARRHGLKRSQMVAQGLRLVMQRAAS
jgi:hypothetical protein